MLRGSIVTALLLACVCAVRVHREDPVEGPAGITGEPNAVVRDELGRDFNLRRLTHGYSTPSINRGVSGPMVPFISSLYETRGNLLKIRVINKETLGEYTFQAYSGRGKPASWSVVVQAYAPEDEWSDNPYAAAPMPREGEVVVTPREPQMKLSTPPPKIEVPVSTVAEIEEGTTRTSSDTVVGTDVEAVTVSTPGLLSSPSAIASPTSVAEIEEGTTITSFDTVVEADVEAVTVSTPGLLSSPSATASPTSGVFIPPKCTDDPYFAICHLIVRSKFCRHKYYSVFCCKSCVEAGELNPDELVMQADESYRRRK